jgi:hypothetical protein
MRYGRIIKVAMAAVAALSGLASTAPAFAAAPDTHPPSVGERPVASVNAAEAANLVDPELEADIARDGEADALLVLRNDDTPAAVSERGALASRAKAVKQKLSGRKAAVVAKAKGVETVEDFDLLPTRHVRIRSAEQLVALARQPDVVRVSAVREMRTGDLNYDSRALVRQPEAAALGYQGQNTYVAVLDTGLDHTRADFGYCTAVATPASCRVAESWDFATNDGALDTGSYHGTNVAGIVAGIAPAAKLLSLDVFNGNSTNNILMNRAMQYLVQRRADGLNIVAANLSIWTKGFATPGTCTDELGFGTARQWGIVPVVISGNGGAKNGVSSPACMPGALTVGAVYDASLGSRGPWGDANNCVDSTTWADKITCFSNSGPNLSMLAPGSSITAAGISMDGTSQAAPHVAGAVAVLASARSLTADQIQQALVSKGRPLTDTNGITRKRLDVAAAVASVVGTGDTVRPTVVAPNHIASLNWSLGSSAVPFTVSWSATDASGINAYELYSSVNGGAWVRESLPSPTTTSKVFSLTPGNRYQFTVAARDGAGNWSSWKNGASFLVSNHPETSAALTYAGAWTQKPFASAYGGQFKVSATPSASATFRFTGTGFAWVATKAANRGQAYLYLDGAYQGTWDLYAASTQAKTVVANWSSATSAAHTVQIVVVGTSGRPNVDVDSFIVTA